MLQKNKLLIGLLVVSMLCNGSTELNNNSFIANSSELKPCSVRQAELELSCQNQYDSTTNQIMKRVSDQQKNFNYREYHLLKAWYDALPLHDDSQKSLSDNCEYEKYNANAATQFFDNSFTRRYKSLSSSRCIKNKKSAKHTQSK
jgi:hypothetical protein